VSLQGLLSAYSHIPRGEAAWVLPDDNQSLEDFQATVAAAEAWEVIGQIEIVEIREENRTGRRLVDAVRIRRLR
jgi:serine/threonine protein kinase HipA of HipAB toxin-antitoxin module